MLVEQGGSDLLLVENAPPCARVEGEVRKLEPASLDGAEIEAALLPALSQHALRLYRQALIADSSYRIEGLGRFRINLHRERGRAAAAIRRLRALHRHRFPGAAAAGRALDRRGTVAASDPSEI